MTIKALTRRSSFFYEAWGAGRVRLASWLVEIDKTEALLPFGIEGMWTIVGVLETLLLLRVLLHGLGIGYSPFTMPAFGITSIVVSPYAASYGLFGSSFQESYLDMPALLSGVMLVVLAWGITKFYARELYRGTV